MQIFGHKWIENAEFIKVFSVENIKDSSVGSIVLLEPLSSSIELAQYCQTNIIPFAVIVSSITEAVLANALKAQYVICQIEDAHRIQAIAQEYLFDTKILTLINREREIEKIAQLSIDGVVFPEAITTN